MEPFGSKGESLYLKKMRRMYQALIISGGLNITLICYLLYGFVSEGPAVASFELKPADKAIADFSNADLIQQFKAMPFEQLVAKLQNSTLVEDGYTQRDLALGSLVAFHHFDFVKAMQGQLPPSQQRNLAFRKTDGHVDEIVLFPGLSSQQWDAIIQFVQTERWPLTSQGIFVLLQSPKDQIDASLLEAFFLTPEFMSVEMLFSRSEVPVSKQDIVKLLLEGTWEMLSRFSTEQRAAQDLSAARRQHFLVDYLDNHSATAAKLMLKIDRQFAIRKLDDAHVLAMLELLKDREQANFEFTQEILTSPRGNAVWQSAASRLYSYAGETLPMPYNHTQALSRFIPENILRAKLEGLAAEAPPKLAPPQAPTVKVPEKSLPNKTMVKTTAPVKAPTATKKVVGLRTHVVQKGDNLWKISKRYNVSVDDIKRKNRLTSDSLKVGSTLVL